MIPDGKDPELAALLDEHLDEVAATWIDLVRSIPDAHYARLPAEELLAHARRDIARFTRALSTGHYAAQKVETVEALLSSLQSDRGLGQFTQDYLLVKSAALRVIQRRLDLHSNSTWDSIAQLDACLTRMIGQFHMWYGEEITRQLREQHQRTTLLLTMAQAAASSLELEDVLSHVAQGLTAAAGVPRCGFYFVDQDRGLLVPRLLVDREPLTSALAEAFIRESVDLTDDSFAGEVMMRMEPVVCGNAQTDPRLDKVGVQCLGVKSILAVPLVHKEQVLAIAFLCSFDEYRTFSKDQIELARGLANSAALAIHNARLYEEVRDQLGELESVQRVTAAMLREVALDELLGIVCSEAQRLTGALGSSVGLVEEDGWLHLAINRGHPRLASRRLPLEGSLAGLVVLTGEPAVSNDPANDERVYHGPEIASALLTVPLTVKGMQIGALSVSNKPKGFTTKDMRITSIFADQAAIAIENARLHQQEQRQAVMEERGRLAREMHDNLAQTLAALNLRVATCQRLLSDGRISQTQEGLTELRESTQRAYSDLRQAMFSLRAASALGQGFVDTLQRYVDGCRTNYGLDALVLVGDQFEPQFAPEVEIQVWRIIQEALTNVRQHAGPCTAGIHLDSNDGQARITVQDDGRGFDLAQIPGERRGHFGLQVMRERAESVGGRLQIHSSPGQGTRVVASVPLARGR